MAKQRLRYTIEWKEGSKVRKESGWTWVGESFDFRIKKKFGFFWATLVGKITTEVEAVEPEEDGA